MIRLDQLTLIILSVGSKIKIFSEALVAKEAKAVIPVFRIFFQIYLEVEWKILEEKEEEDLGQDKLDKILCSVLI